MLENTGTVADAIVREARARAEQILAEGVAKANQIEGDAIDAADGLIESELAGYRVRAMEIIDTASADSRLLVANARERAERIEDQAKEGAAEVFAQLETSLVEREALAGAKTSAPEREATAVFETKKAEADAIREKARDEASKVLAAATKQRDDLLGEAKSMHDSAQSRLEDAVTMASERGASSARKKIEQQMVDTCREIEQLQSVHRKIVEDAQAEAAKVRLMADERAALIVKEGAQLADNVARDAGLHGELQPETIAQLNAYALSLDALRAEYADSAAESAEPSPSPSTASTSA